MSVTKHGTWSSFQLLAASGPYPVTAGADQIAFRNLCQQPH